MTVNGSLLSNCHLRTLRIKLGSLPHCDLTIRAPSELALAKLAGNGAVLLMIKQHSLMATGIGYIGAHLLASARL